ncbi:hypothetical protein [Sphingobacterium sp. LRF_L2]|uniref:hypothetical protein n=1 Tax=Sphingobacterium sp. LRF_L2 TaxID=3369421 RepID=UPI003F5F0B11
MLKEKNTLNRTESAILDLLSIERSWMNFDDIFSHLNPNTKVFSYAAIYKNIRNLQQKGLIICRRIQAHRKDYFCVNTPCEDLQSI